MQSIECIYISPPKSVAFKVDTESGGQIGNRHRPSPTHNYCNLIIPPSKKSQVKMLTLKRWRCTPSTIHISRNSRAAHAAAATSRDEDENQAGPSTYNRRSPGSKGRPSERDNTVGGEKEYRYPAKGRAGGEPDPFEVMALDRTASQSAVKKQCTSPTNLAAMKELVDDR